MTHNYWPFNKLNEVTYTWVEEKSIINEHIIKFDATTKTKQNYSLYNDGDKWQYNLAPKTEQKQQLHNNIETLNSI